MLKKDLFIYLFDLIYLIVLESFWCCELPYRTGQQCSGIWQRARSCTVWRQTRPSAPCASPPTATGCAPPLTPPSRCSFSSLSSQIQLTYWLILLVMTSHYVLVCWILVCYVLIFVPCIDWLNVSSIVPLACTGWLCHHVVVCIC